MTYFFALALSLFVGAAAVSAGTVTIIATENEDGFAVLSGSGTLNLSGYSADNTLRVSTVRFGTQGTNNTIYSLDSPRGSSLVRYQRRGAPDYQAQSVSRKQEYTQRSGSGHKGSDFAYFENGQSVFFYLRSGVNPLNGLVFETTYFGVSVEDLAPNYGTIFNDGVNEVLLVDGTAPVPLPAGGVLLLGGLAAFFATRPRALSRAKRSA